MANPTPAAEIEIDEPLVRRMLVDQAPAFADLALELFATGWDNTILALGPDHLVRLPHRKQAVDLVRHEHRWLPILATRLPIAIPVPVVAGRPSVVFPWPWSIVERVAGADAIATPPEAKPAVQLMSQFFSAMHIPAPDDAPLNPWRGGPVGERDEITQKRFDRLDSWLDGRADADRLRRLWQMAVEADVYDGPPIWIHGDVHPGNVIVRDGQIVSVIDFGDLTSGDRATDLGSAWMLFDSVDRLELRRLLDIDDATWCRARGWALSVALAIAQNSADNPRYETMCAEILVRVASDSD